MNRFTMKALGTVIASCSPEVCLTGLAGAAQCRSMAVLSRLSALNLNGQGCLQ